MKLPDSDQDSVIVFSIGNREPEVDEVAGKRKKKEPKWAAFLSIDTQPHASTIIEKQNYNPIKPILLLTMRIVVLGGINHCFEVLVFAIGRNGTSRTKDKPGVFTDNINQLLTVLFHLFGCAIG